MSSVLSERRGFRSTGQSDLNTPAGSTSATAISATSGAPNVDTEGARLNRFIRCTDWPGLFLFGAVLLVAGNMYPVRQMPQDFLNMIWTRTFCSWLCAFGSGYALYLNFERQPMPADAARPVYCVFGRNIFLTRHCLALQFVHLVSSALAESIVLFWQREFPVWLLSTCYGNALFVGVLSSFVTIQYWKLVRTDPEFLQDCEAWTKKGVPQKWIQDAMHSWALPLAMMDMLVVKQRAMLVSIMPPVLWVILGIACFGLYYMFLLHVNHWATGAWPYGICEKVDERGFHGWLSFWALQTSIQVVIMFAACVPVRVLPAFF